MKNKYLFTLVFSICICSAQAQVEKPILNCATKSQVFTTPCAGEAITQSGDLKWRPLLISEGEAHGPGDPQKALTEKIKEEKNRLKLLAPAAPDESSTQRTSQTITPIMGTNYAGNKNIGGSPMDNHIAISDGGIIVSVANKTLEVDDINGNNLYYNTFSTFFNTPSFTYYCDPLVVYDPQADRFIVFVQTYNVTTPTGGVRICFSKTNNPATGGWWIYNVTGNPFGNGTYFDYPKMAISDNELFITGNLYLNYNLSTFYQGVIYQIKKANGYAGTSLTWQCWNNITPNTFTLTPVSHGLGESSGSGIYIVALVSGGSTTLKLFHLTDSLGGSPAINYYPLTTTGYAAPGDASQLGTNCKLQTGACKMMNGFILNGIIHFVYHSDVGSGWSGIVYNRLNVSTKTNQRAVHSAAGTYDYAYPAVASFASNPTDKSVMIGFAASGPSIWPQVKVVSCDDAMVFSNSIIVKASTGYASITSSTSERWGDYTGMTRKYNSPYPSVWMAGMFANTSHVWNSWISEIHSDVATTIAEEKTHNQVNVFPNPVYESFVVEFTLDENTDVSISIFDINGKEVKSLYSGIATAGKNLFSFNKANLASGIYFLNVKSNSGTLVNEKIAVSGRN